MCNLHLRCVFPDDIESQADLHFYVSMRVLGIDDILQSFVIRDSLEIMTIKVMTELLESNFSIVSHPSA